MNVIRPQAAEALAEARSKGDLAENAEFDAAREKLASVDRQIFTLHQKISKVNLINEGDISTDSVRVLTSVTLLNLKNNKEITYIIVDPLQADPTRKQISLKSPIAKGLLGRKVDDEVSILVPSGRLNFRVLKIEKCKGL